MPRSHLPTPSHRPSSHHRPPERGRRRPGVAASAAAVAATLVFSFATVTAANARAVAPDAGGRVAGDPPFGDVIASLIENMAGFANESRSASTRGSVARAGRTESWTALVTKREATESPRLAGTCQWAMKTDLQAVYDMGTGDLRQVISTPEATLSCDGTVGGPVRQDAMIQQSRNGRAATTVARHDCTSSSGCSATTVRGTAECTGMACAGQHQLVLRHVWTLPPQFAWASAPGECMVSDRGTTLTCVTRSTPVTIAARRL